MDKTTIVKIHIEKDIVNKANTLVYTDEKGVEWVDSQDSEGHSHLVHKEDSWYFKKLKPQN